ncbi:unnamed protein product, partial [Iphiclides podalirius]
MSLFIRTDATAVKLYEEFVLAGIGSSIYAYAIETAKFIEAFNNVLEGQKIYGIVPNNDKLKLLVFGGKQFKIIERTKQGSSLFDFSPGSIVCDDWLHSGVWLPEMHIAVLTAHNVVQIWDVSNEPLLMSRTINKDNSILYSGLLLPLTDDLLVFSGTVFSEVIISRCKKVKTLHRLIGHKGVIFSISCSLQRRVIVTTSDDRSVRVWTLNSPNKNCNSADFWDEVNISCAHELYGHSARVMRSCISDEYILSVGEDSAVCFWDSSGRMARRVAVHQNAPIWSIDLDERRFVTGGGDCGVILHPLSVAAGFSHSDRVEVDKGTAKQLAFTARRNMVILSEPAELIYYDSVVKSKTVHSLHYDSTYIMMSMSPCRQILAVADMSGQLDVFIENCKGPASVRNVVTAKLPINRILSMHWASSRHLVFCSGIGEVYVIASKREEVEVVGKFSLPRCKERWLTSSAISDDNELLVVGDRCGNVHCYLKGEQNPIKTFGKVHGRYGPTSIRVRNDRIVTTGRDGTLKYFSVANNGGAYRIKLVRSQEVGFQWVERCVDSEGKFACGFQERVFVITDLRNGSKIVEVPCGGGHRSWDVVRYFERIDNAYEQLIKLVYLKNSDVNIETFHMDRILSIDIIKGTHSKEINCLKSLVSRSDDSVIFFVTGGEDTTLRVSTCSKSVHFQDDIVLKQLSNVRTLRVCGLDEDNFLLVSGGGRAQICIRSITLQTDNGVLKAVVEDLVEFLVKGTDKERKGDRTWRGCTVDFDPETRIMDLEIVKVDEENFLVYAGCSDAYIRVFELSCVDDKVAFKPSGQLKHHKTCVLKTHLIEFRDRTILATCTTRGEVCLWDVTTAKNCSELSPFLVFTANKSGINCVASKQLSDTEFLIATGGDDNALHLNVIDVRLGDLGTAKVVHTWISDNIHCSQITGLVIAGDVLVTASIDQRVTVLRVRGGGRDVTFLYQVMSDVADVQGLDLVAKSNGFLTVRRNIKMAPQVTAVTEPVTLGEGPHWDDKQQALYFVSIFDRSIHKYVPATKKHTRSVLDDMVGFIVPVEGKPDRFVVGMKRVIAEVAWDGEDGTAKVVRTIAEVDKHCPDNRLNDGKADPRGRLFAGTMGHEYEPGKFHLKKGALYRLDPDGGLHTVVENVDISNGLCWDLKEKAFYYADSFEYAIRRYDYDVETGDISNPRFVFNYKDHSLGGIVDGMTIDTDGNLWVANFDGHQVLKIDPKKSKLLQKVPIPALQVTSVTFGGPDLDVLYVTSACMNRGEEQKPPCGSTFQLTGLGVKGRPNANVRIN